MEEYIGIDYGMGLSNRDPENMEFHYGIIPAHGIPYIWDQLESNYPGPFCPKCGYDALDTTDDEAIGEDIRKSEWYQDLCDTSDTFPATTIAELVDNLQDNEYCCVGCRYTFDSQEAYSDEPIDHTYEDNEYSLMADGDGGDLWVFKSPYYSLSAYCSPCAPGAGYLTSPRDNGIRTYCLGPEYWPEESDMPNQICPYSIWRVSDDVQVYSPTVAQDDIEA